MLLACASGCAKTAADRPLAHADDQDDDDDDALVAEAGRRSALPAEPAGQPPQQAAELTGVFVDPSLAATCGIPVEPEPYFEYDSAAVEPEDNPLLRRLADCLTTGPLAGRKVELRGHTDPSVTREDNDQVSMSRAESVRSFLTVEGVAPDAIEVSPDGDTAAIPEAPSDWPYERRVDIVLLPVD